MDKSQIKLSDWYRILFGEAPVTFLIEVLLRSVIIYFTLLIVVRFLGKRMAGELSILEVAVMITLGAIISGPMQIPDRGIFQGVVILICALTFQRGINFIGFKSATAERWLHGKESLLVKNGIIQVKEMQKVKISRQQLYTELRNKGIYNLGEVKRVYFEASGLFSIFKLDQPKPGLSILPPGDKEVHTIQHSNSEHVLYTCENCGFTIGEDAVSRNCINCNYRQWTKAIEL